MPKPYQQFYLPPAEPPRVDDIIDIVGHDVVVRNGSVRSSNYAADAAGALLGPDGIITEKARIQSYVIQGTGMFSFGDGSDGDVTSSGDITLSDDAYYNDLTIEAGDTLFPAGWRIFCAGTFRLKGTVSRNGNNGTNGGNGGTGAGGTAGTGGAALADGYLKGSVAGQSGGAGGAGTVDDAPGQDGADGVAGTGTSNSIGGNGQSGGAGGQPGSGAWGVDPDSGAAGAGGGATESNVKLIANWHLATLLDVATDGSTVKFDNGAGAGSGGGGQGGVGGAGNHRSGSGGGGGGSGSPGGIIAIYAKRIIIEPGGLIEANGGNGGNGGNASAADDLGSGSAVGGGGGGGAGAGANGGQVILVFNELLNNGSISVAGGTGGTGGTGAAGFAGGGTGQNGSNGNDGSAGTIRLFQISL